MLRHLQTLRCPKRSSTPSQFVQAGDPQRRGQLTIVQWAKHGRNTSVRLEKKSPPCLGQQVRRARGSRGNMGLRLPLKARTAQNRRATSRLKRNRCGRSTFGTIRLSFDAYPYLGASLGASLGLAFLAAFWVVSEMFFDEEKLLSSRENELGVAINALQNPVRKFHGLLSAASEIPECRVRAKFHGARMGVGKYVSGLTASQPRHLGRGQQSGGTWSVLTPARTVHATFIHTKASSPTTLPWLDGFWCAGAFGRVNSESPAPGVRRFRAGVVDADVPAKYRHLSLL